MTKKKNSNSDSDELSVVTMMKEDSSEIDKDQIKDVPVEEKIQDSDSGNADMTESDSEDEASETIDDDKTGLESEIALEPEPEPEVSEPDVTSLPGVGAATAEKLNAAGFSTLMAIAVASPGELVEAAGITESVGRKIIQAARGSMKMGFQSGEDILKRRELVEKISSGCASIDKILGGGFETGAIVECFGEFGSGKTQIGHVLAVNCRKMDRKNVVVYIDTENTFRPERIVQLAKGQGIEPQDVLRNIKVARAFNSDHQMLLAETVEDLIVKQKMNVKLVIVDSLTAHFRAEFIGRGTLAERQQKINKHMHILLKLADTHNICVYVTNQVMAKPDVFFGDPTQAIGGHIVAHASTYRIYLRKGRKGSRVAKLVDSPYLPEGEAAFMVEESGLRDFP